MFKLKIAGDTNSPINKMRIRFNNKSFLYRAKVFIKVDCLAFYLRYLRKYINS